MEINRAEIDIESRFRAVKLSSLHALTSGALMIRVAGIDLEISFDADWADEIGPICRTYWSQFVSNSTTSKMRIALSRAEGEFASLEHPMWNVPTPFMTKVEDRTGTWIFHRDFTCLKRGVDYRVWLPTPNLDFTDALDNLISIAVRDEAEKANTFLFHASVIEDSGHAIVLFGPSGIGKSTAARLSSEKGRRVMASDQVYLRIDGERLMASASPTRNPDIPRCPLKWATDAMEVKSLLALKRTGELQVAPMDRAEFTRRFFAEIFHDENELDFGAALKFACDVSLLRNLKFGTLSYPYGFDFWPRLAELGYT